MGKNLYPFPPHELLDTRPMKSVGIINPPYRAHWVGYPWIPESMDKIAILIHASIESGTVTESSKVMDVLLPLGIKHQCFV
jgi:hypothetical protein